MPSPDTYICKEFDVMIMNNKANNIIALVMKKKKFTADFAWEII